MAQPVTAAHTLVIVVAKQVAQAEQWRRHFNQAHGACVPPHSGLAHGVRTVYLAASADASVGLRADRYLVVTVTHDSVQYARSNQLAMNSEPWHFRAYDDDRYLAKRLLGGR